MRTKTLYDSPVGTLTLVGDDGVLAGVYLPHHRHAPDLDLPLDEDGLGAVREQLSAYFAGDLTTFDVPRHTAGTPFQREVWSALGTIPYGATWSYRRLAEAVGRPAAARAVGLANGRNPLSVVVPCHRVVGAGGDLVGYGGGLAAKRWLLDHEAGSGAWSNASR